MEALLSKIFAIYDSVYTSKLGNTQINFLTVIDMVSTLQNNVVNKQSGVLTTAFKIAVETELGGSA